MASEPALVPMDSSELADPEHLLELFADAAAWLAPRRTAVDPRSFDHFMT